MTSIVKEVGRLRITLSEPWPRWLEVMRTDRDDSRLFGLSIEDARDLHYALGRVITMAETADR